MAEDNEDEGLGSEGASHVDLKKSSLCTSPTHVGALAYVHRNDLLKATSDAGTFLACKACYERETGLGVRAKAWRKNLLGALMPGKTDLEQLRIHRGVRSSRRNAKGAGKGGGWETELGSSIYR